MPQDPRAMALQALSHFLVAESSLGDTLQRVSDITLDAIPSAEIVGMTLLSAQGKPTTAVYTDPESPAIDSAQYDSGNGPCLDAWRQRRVIRVDDTGSSDEYPEFAEAARAHGVHSTLSLPLAAGDRATGALNLYARTTCGFDAGDEEVGTDLATAAGIALANSSAYWGAVELSEQLSTAMRSRAVIEQAKGMLMAQSPGLTPDHAFDMLRQASQRENVKLRDIAQRIVDRQPLSARTA